MRIIFTPLAVFLLASSTNAQNKKDLAVSFSVGLLNSPYYKKANAEGFYCVDFDYYLAKRHILSANFFAGKHRYYDDELSNEPTYGLSQDGTNATAKYLTFSVEYKYKLVDDNAISIVPGVGVGILTHTRVYPWTEVNKAYPATSSWSDLTFPISLDIIFKPSSFWQFGLTSGFLIHPGYPILALHAGPKLSYVIK